MLLGAASVFGFAPFYLFPVPILALALFYRGLQGSTPRGGFLRGFAFGLGWFLAGVSWVYVSMHDIGGLSLPLAGAATILFAAFLGLFPALACSLAGPWPPSRNPTAPLLFSAFWGLAEWPRRCLFTGFSRRALARSTKQPC